MKSSTTHFFVMLAVLAGALTSYGLWYQAVSSMSARAADLQDQIDTNTQSLARIAAARAALTEISGDEAAVQSYFVPDTGVVGFIDDLQARGHMLGSSVVISSVSAGSTGTHSALRVALTVHGAFDAVLRTIGSIEYAPYDLSVVSLTVSQDGKNSWYGEMTITVG